MAVSIPKKWIRSSYSSFSSERFSPLLLEAYEYYFEDYSVTYFPVSEDGKIDVDRKSRGRLKLCSNSLVYDPQDYSLPVVKLPFRECGKILEYNPPGSQKPPKSKGVITSTYFIMEVTKHCTMLQNGVIGPYKFNKETQTFVFKLNFGDLAPVLADICTFYGASKLNAGERDRVTLDVLKSRYSRFSFNMSWLEELHEKIIVEMAGEKITPMVGNPGRVLLTSHRLYFQPFNNAEVEPVLKMHLRDLKRVLGRRYVLRHVGLELITKYGDNMFIVFETTELRDRMFKKILEQPGVAVEDMNLEVLTLKWQNRELSNYDYLMALNVLADRSINDIIQYPVFPWVIADYTSQELDLTNPKTFRDLSKPIGALSKDRLTVFQERYQDTPGNKFLYGTHYSAPAFVLFYLVRTAPEYLLCLQNGHFDHPNRMFHSIAGTWTNVLSSATDLKELIPEFYEPPGDFLLNVQNLDLGYRSDGVKLGNVVLPPWAKSSMDFTVKCREALECDYVSRHLHLWFDLIFGYKQTGREALKANNVFHYLSYEGEVNLEEVQDPTELASLQVQIREFGQTPKQLFFTPHQSRYGQKTEVTAPASPKVPMPTARLDSLSLGPKKESGSPPSGAPPTPSSPPNKPQPGDRMVVTHRQKMHKDQITDVKLSPDGTAVFTTSTDKNMKALLLDSKEFIAQASLSQFPLSSVAVLPDSKTVLLGCWDNTIYAYSIEYGAKLSKTLAHDSSVSCLQIRGSMVVSGSWDSTIKVWTLDGNHTLTEELELDHEGKVLCVDVDSQGLHLAAGSEEGFVCVWNIADGLEIQPSRAIHTGAVHAVMFSEDGNTIISSAEDSTLAYWKIYTGELDIFTTPDPFRCFRLQKDNLIAGTSSGDVIVWSLAVNAPVAKKDAHSGPVTCMDIAKDKRIMVTGGEDRHLLVWSLN